MPQAGSIVLPRLLARLPGTALLVLGLAVAAGAALVIEPTWLVVALGAGIFVVAALSNPIVPAGLTVLLSGFGLSFLGGRSIAAYGADLNDWVVLLLVLGAFASCLVSGRLPLRASVVLPVVIGLLLLAPPFGAVVDASAGLKLVVQATVPFLLFLVVRYGAFERSEFEIARHGARLLAGAIALSVILTGVALLADRPIFTTAEGGSERFTGSLGAGAFAFFLLTPIAVALAAFGRRPSVGRSAVLTVLAGALLITLTRGALIAAAATVLWLGVAQRRVKEVLIVCLLTAGLFFALFEFAPAAVSRFEATSTASDELVRGTWLGREALWQFTWHELVVPSPWLGSGLGSTAPIFAEATQFRTGAGAMHNDYLWILAETGAVGLGLYLLAVVAVARAIWRSRHRAGYVPNALAVARSAAGPALLAFTIVSFADNAIGNFAHYGVLVFALAGLACRGSQSTPAFTETAW